MMSFPGHNGEINASLFPGDVGTDMQTPDNKRPPILLLEIINFFADRVTIDLFPAGMIVEHRGNRVMGTHPRQVRPGRRDEFFVGRGAVTKIRDIARRGLQHFFEMSFKILAEKFFRKLQDPAGVLEDLHPFDAGDLIEEPAATGVHEHRVALKFKKL